MTMLAETLFLPAVASPTFTRLLIAILGLVLWRLFKFSIRPSLYPNEPKPLPYWIPFFGHVYSFVTDQENFLLEAKKRMGGTDRPFAITLAGRKVYIINSPTDVATVYRSTAALSFDGFIKIIAVDFGMQPSSVERLYQKRQSADSKANLSVADLFHHMRVKQGQGQDLRHLQNEIDDFFQKDLFLEAMRNQKTCQPEFSLPSVEEDSCTTLLAWTREVFINGTQLLFFGDSLARLNPRLPQLLAEFDDLSWQVFFGVPKILRFRLNTLRNELMETFKQYLKIPQAARGCKAFFTNALEDEYRTTGLTDSDIASQFLFFHWGITTNSSKVIYWLMVRLLFDPSLMAAIRQETRAAYPDTSGDDKTSNHTILTSENCPRLDSLWWEVLRTTQAAATVRTVESDFSLGGTLLRRGATTLFSARVLHYRTSDFGADAAEFNANRFTEKPQLKRSGAFRPHGGGMNQCPGRFFAKYMGFSFVAAVLKRFEIVELKGGVGGQEMPRERRDKPAVGIVEGDRNLVVRFLRRKRNGV